MKRCFILLGLTSMVAQVLVLRELSIIFYGNELFLSATLASWLLLTAVGSGFVGLAADAMRRRLDWLIGCLAAGGVLVPLSLVAARASRMLLMRGGETVVPFSGMCVVTLGLLLPLCLVLGFMFTLACRVAMDAGREYAADVGQVYVLEAVGTIAGGMVFSFVLAELFSTFTVALGLAFLDLAAATVLWWRRGKARSAWGCVIGAALIGTGVILFTPLGRLLDIATQKLRVPGYVLRDFIDTPYGHVDVTSRHGRINFLESGVVVGSTEMDVAAEQIAHLPMLYHPRPERVVLVGGGVSGVLRELLKHPVRHVDYVELDPGLIAAARRFAREADRRALGSGRVTVHERLDGRLFIKRARQQYDAIIVDLPDPTTGLLNRLYTREFFEEARAALRPGGVFAIGLSGSTDYMSPELRALSASVYRTLRLVFPGTTVVPGDGAHYFLAPKPPPRERAKPGAAHSARAKAPDWRVLAARWRERRIKGAWMSGQMIEFLLQPLNVDRLFDQLRDAPYRQVNVDFKPISFYYAMLHWQHMMGDRGGALLRRLLQMRLSWVFWAAALAAVVVGVAARWRRSPRGVSVPAALACGGMTGLLLEVALIFAFQSLYGYAYRDTGLLFASFMLGLALGGWAALRRMERLSDVMFALILAQAALAVWAALMPFGFRLFQGHAGAWATQVGVRVCLPLMNLVVGALVGVQFPLGVKARAEATTRHTAGGAGVLYAFDLLGSCAAAFISGAILIPVLGIMGTCYSAAIVSAASAAMLIATEWRRVRPGGPSCGQG